MDRSLPAAIALAAGVAAGAPAFAQPAPASDPRLESLLNQNVIVALERSISLERAVPQPPAPLRPKPRVDEPGLVRVEDGLYIDKRLRPRRSGPDDEGAVRVFPRDR